MRLYNRAKAGGYSNLKEIEAGIRKKRRQELEEICICELIGSGRNTTFITHAQSTDEYSFGLFFLFFIFIFGVTLVHANLCMHILVSLLKMVATLGMCLIFKTVVLSYRSYDTHFKIFKMERESFKKYSKAAIVEKKSFKR